MVFRADENWNQYFEPHDRCWRKEERLRHLGMEVDSRADFIDYYGNRELARHLWRSGVRPICFPYTKDHPFSIVDTHTGLQYWRVGHVWHRIGDIHPNFEYAETNEIIQDISKSLPNVLVGQIPTFYVKDRCAAINVLKDIANTVPNNFCVYYRGQTSHYEYPYPEILRGELGHEEDYNPPSLVPTLGRHSQDYRAINVEAQKWTKPFLLWIMSSFPKCRYVYPKVFELCQKALCEDGYKSISRILIHLDEVGPEDLHDLWFEYLEHHRDVILPLVLQHYGFPSTYLDVTDDIDVALFFLSADVTARRHIAEKHTGVIYVMCVAEDSTSVRRYDEVFSKIASTNYGRLTPTQSLYPYPKRIENQKGSVFWGASYREKNVYANYVVAVVLCELNGCWSNVTFNHMFPAEDEDELYAMLRKARPMLKDLY